MSREGLGPRLWKFTNLQFNHELTIQKQTLNTRNPMLTTLEELRKLENLLLDEQGAAPLAAVLNLPPLPSGLRGSGPRV